ERKFLENKPQLLRNRSAPEIRIYISCDSLVRTQIFRIELVRVQIKHQSAAFTNDALRGKVDGNARQRTPEASACDRNTPSGNLNDGPRHFHDGSTRRFDPDRCKRTAI